MRGRTKLASGGGGIPGRRKSSQCKGVAWFGRAQNEHGQGTAGKVK